MKLYGMQNWDDDYANICMGRILLNRLRTPFERDKSHRINLND